MIYNRASELNQILNSSAKSRLFRTVKHDARLSTFTKASPDKEKDQSNNRPYDPQ